MSVLTITLCVILLIMAVFLTVAVLMQHGKSHNLSGTIAGGAETFFGKTKGRSVDAMLSKITTVVSVIFVILVIIVYILQPNDFEQVVVNNDDVNSVGDVNDDGADTDDVIDDQGESEDEQGEQPENQAPADDGSQDVTDGDTGADNQDVTGSEADGGADVQPEDNTGDADA